MQAGIDLWNADGGGDLPEDNLNALFHLATGAVHFRDGGTRIGVIFGDAPSHDPSIGHSIPDTIAALKLNATTTTPTSVTQQAVVLDTLLTDVVISEAHADIHGSTANPTGNPCRV